MFSDTLTSSKTLLLGLKDLGSSAVGSEIGFRSGLGSRVSGLDSL